MSAELLHSIADTRRAVAGARRGGAVVGLVPTMGALHEGHGALIRLARRETGFVVVSVFVNPIQFDRRDDFERYPRTLSGDLEFCDALGVDAVFAPEASEMYPAPPLTFVEAPALSGQLCGQFRPGHFRGVATVVDKLFHIVQPDRAYFGEKDAQQLAVIRRMTADLSIPVTIVGVPTVRQPDGLALSSRNQRLSAEELKLAPLLYQSLQEAVLALRRGERASDAKQAGLGVLQPAGQIRVEYFEVVDAEALQPVEQVTGPVLIALAAWLGKVRLIDNASYAPDAGAGTPA